MFLVNKKYRDIIFFKAKVHLKSEASHTYLSFLWWAIDPIISMAIYYLVFGILLERGTEDFVPFLLIGLVTWQWFGNCVTHSMNAISQNSALISQVSFPKVILPSVNIVIDTFKFSIVFALLLVFLWSYGFLPTVHYAALPLVLIVQHLLNCTIANILAGLVPMVPDLKLVFGNILRVGMYLSGIFYSYHAFPSEYHIYFEANPFAMLIDAYRDILMYQRWPQFDLLGLYLAVSVICLYLSVRFVRWLDPFIPRILLQK